MIENLRTDKDILNFLMTSDFLEDELTPSQLRDLLLKFRWFYRSSHSKQISMGSKIKKLEGKIEKLERDNISLSKELLKRDDRYDSVVNRDLSFKERLSGKIYENKSKRKIKLKFKFKPFFSKLKNK